MELKLQSVELTLVTCGLTKALLKQMRLLSYEQVRSLIKDGQIQGVIGWVHGSVLDKGEDHKTWLIIQFAPGQYGRYDAMTQSRTKYVQIYV